MDRRICFVLLIAAAFVIGVDFAAKFGCEKIEQTFGVDRGEGRSPEEDRDEDIRKLREMMQSDDAEARIRAAGEVVKMAETGAAAAATLVEYALESCDAEVRLVVAWSLAGLAKQGHKETVKILALAQLDPEPQVRWHAAYALRYLDMQNSGVFPLYNRARLDSDRGVRFIAEESKYYR
ncbi:MAG: HEAT repeat domain-containing protein [Patescibacteria group bacterium]